MTEQRDRFRVACVQIEAPADAATTDHLERAVELASSVDCELVMLPELWPVGYFGFDRYRDRAEPLDGPTLGLVSELAAARGIYVHGGSIVERAPDGRLHNTSLLVGPTGELLLTYRKHHLFSHRSRERELLAPGNEVDTVATALGGVGLTTCYDLRFPELYRRLVDGGAETVLVTSAWPAERLEHWLLLTRCRALENQVYLVACNASGVDHGVAVAGNSVVVDPWGDVVSRAGDGEQVLVTDIDLSRLRSLRSEFPVLDDRRTAGAAR